MAYSNIYIIPDAGNMKGGELWDRYGNLSYFVDVTGLTDKTVAGGTDIEMDIPAHKRKPYLNAKALISVPAHKRYASVGINQPKGAKPGYTVTFSDSVEKRQFQYTGTLSGLYAYCKANAAVNLTIYGPTGAPKDPIAVVEGAAAIAKGE